MIGWRGRHSPINLQRQRSALTLQQAPPLPHGHLAGVLIGIQVDGGVVHRRLRRNQDRGRGGGGRGWVRDRRWGRRKRRSWGTGVGGCGSEGGGRGRDEGSEGRLRRSVLAPRAAAPVRSGGFAEGAGGVRVWVGWWRRGGEGHRLYDV